MCLKATPPFEQPSCPISKSVKPAKKYDDAFKRQAIENWIRCSRHGTQIARELGISYLALKDWRRRYSSSPRGKEPRMNQPKKEGGLHGEGIPLIFSPTPEHSSRRDMQHRSLAFYARYFHSEPA